MIVLYQVTTNANFENTSIRTRSLLAILRMIKVGNEMTVIYNSLYSTMVRSPSFPSSVVICASVLRISSVRISVSPNLKKRSVSRGLSQSHPKCSLSLSLSLSHFSLSLTLILSTVCLCISSLFLSFSLSLFHSFSLFLCLSIPFFLAPFQFQDAFFLSLEAFYSVAIRTWRRKHFLGFIFHS